MTWAFDVRHGKSTVGHRALLYGEVELDVFHEVEFQFAIEMYLIDRSIPGGFNAYMLMERRYLPTYHMLGT